MKLLLTAFPNCSSERTQFRGLRVAERQRKQRRLLPGANNVTERTTIHFSHVRSFGAPAALQMVTTERIRVEMKARERDSFRRVL